MKTTIGLPRVVTRDEWREARNALLEKEKAATQARDGRQEDWEDSPKGWPQTPPYTWWRYHDEYQATES